MHSTSSSPFASRLAAPRCGVASAVALLAGSLLTVGCPRVCGPGTFNVDGVCVPTLECGAGTAADGGVCRPLLACGPATFQQDGTCVPLKPEDLPVDVTETVEPNDPFGAGPLAPFLLPEPGGDPVTVGGNVDAGAGPDFDGFLFTADAARRLRLTGFSRGAASVAFVVQGLDPGINDSYQRVGMHTGGAHASREIMLPVPGMYMLIVSEAVNILSLFGTPEVPFGGPDAGYGVLVESLPLPEPDPVTPPVVIESGLLVGALRYYSVASAPGMTLSYAATPVATSFLPVVMTFSADDWSLVGPAAGAATGTVPLDDELVVVQDFVIANGFEYLFELALDTP